jgi:hypothetical protein
MAFGSLGVEGNELMPVVYDTSIQAPLDVLARAQITTLMAKAVKANQQKPLEERIAAKWKDLTENKKPDIDNIRGFVAMFGAQSSVGRKARLQLAEQLMAESGSTNMMEAERHLLLLRRQTEEPELAAQAVETLARLSAKKEKDGVQLTPDSIYYYRVLANEFPKVVVKDGKTGEDLYNELVTDKRYWGYLDEGAPSWTGGKLSIEGKVETGQNQNQQPRMAMTFEPEGEVTPFHQKLQVSFDLQYFQLRVINRAGNETLVSHNVARMQELQMFLGGFAGNGQMPKMTYHIMGHMIVVPVGYMVYGVDLVNRKVVWDKNFLGEGSLIGNGGRLQPDPTDGSLWAIYPDGAQRKIGRAGPIQPGYVCLQLPEGLTAIDPISGRTLWVRSDISQRSTMFGDDQMVYVVEMNEQNNPASTKALRAQDGAAMPVPDFTSVYAQRQRVIGRTILLSENKGNKTILRLYDVAAGKDVWSKDFPAGSTTIRSEVPHLAGAIDPKGKVTLIDLRTLKEILHAEVDPKHLEKVQAVTLLEDQTDYYLAFNGPADPKIAQFGGVRSNFQPSTGVRCVPINGLMYAFHKDGGETHWRAD